MLNIYVTPVMLTDSTGTSPKWWEWLITGLVIAVGVVACIVPGGQGLGVALLVAGGSMLASNIMSAAGVDGKTASIISSALNIVAGVVLCFTPFAAVGASMIGAGVGGIAGGYISEALGGRFETGSMIGSIVGGIIGGQIHKGLTGGFASRAAFKSHYNNHGVKMGYTSMRAYAKDARYVMNAGTKITYMYKGTQTTGYIRFLGQGGGANYAFVGMRGSNIATFGVRSVESLMDFVPWLII